MAENSIIELVNVTKSFDGETVLDNINLKVKDREFLTLLGPSGCGKTTTLRIIGGFEYPDTGDVFFAHENIVGMPPYKRDINTVFQKYALFPFLNVYDNIAFGLKVKKLPKKEIDKRVKHMLELVNLKGFEKRDVSSLSGGQQQRIAIARALVNQPKVLLLDEPLGALDLKLRKDMQVELKDMQKKLGITFVYVTHDQEEALTMSDTVVVMNNGEIQQIGTPEDIYNEPVNAFVASFIGESNIFEGSMDKDYSVFFAGHRFDCVDKRPGESRDVEVVVRPEDIDITTPEKGMLKGYVESVTFKGVHYEIVVVSDEKWWTAHSTDYVEQGAEVGLIIEPDAIHVMKTENELLTFEGETENGKSIWFSDTSFEYDCAEFENKTLITVSVDPEFIKCVAPGEGLITVTVDDCIFKGDYYELTCWRGDYFWKLYVDDAFDSGASIDLVFDAEAIKIAAKETK